MKLKKMLASILCIAMVFGTMGITVFADEAPAGTLTSSQINMKDVSETFISSEINGLKAKKSVVIKTFDSNGVKLATTTLLKPEYYNMDVLGVKIIITGDSSSWSTVWEEGKLRADYVPSYATLYVDGVEMNKANVPMITTGGETAVNWAEVPGVAPAPVVAKIGETYYESLQAAISVAQSGDVITLFDNVTLTNAITVPDGVTIDLNDKTMYLNVENSYFNNSTIKNGEIILGKSSTHVCDGYIHVNDGKTLTIDAVEMTSSEEGMKAYAVFHMHGASQLNLTNVNIDVKDNEYAGSVIYAGNANPVVTIDECTIKGENVGRGSVYGTIIANNSTIEFKGSTETGLEHGFNRSVLTLNNTDVIVSGAYGRGISVGASGNVVITNGSVVDVTDCDEAGIAFKDGTTYTLTVSGEGTTVTTAEIVDDSDTSVIVTDGAVLAQQTALVVDGNTKVTCNDATVSGTQKSSGAVTSGGIEKKWCAYKFEIKPTGNSITVEVDSEKGKLTSEPKPIANIEKATTVVIGVTATGVDNLTSIAVTTVE